jgi:xanthine/CO dehydrogenase XdhC/CoxF family maturation factor
LVCGAGPDAEPVVSAARALGWQVTVVDHRAASCDARRFPGALVILADADAVGRVVDMSVCHAAVVMSHVLDADAAYLAALAEPGGPGYIGLLGPAARRARLMQKLGPEVADALSARLHSPVGLNLGAVIPESIALSIVSEIHAWLAGH